MPWVDVLVAVRHDALEPLEAVAAAEPTEPFRICIQDLNIGAVRMGPAGEVVCMHWDFAGPNQRAWELGYVLRQWAGDRRTNPGTAGALVDGYREVAGDVPELDRSSFWIAITASLNWIYDQVGRAISAAGERRDFSQAELRSELDDPLTVQRIDRLLAEIG